MSPSDDVMMLSQHQIHLCPFSWCNAKTGMVVITFLSLQLVSLVAIECITSRIRDQRKEETFTTSVLLPVNIIIVVLHSISNS